MKATTQLFHGDCLDVMPRLPAACVDLILADLPYGITSFAWDKIIPLERLWAEYRRVLKRSGAVVLSSKQPFASRLIASNPKWFRHEWIWEKQKGANFQQCNQRPMSVHENVLIFCERSPRYRPQKTDLHRRYSVGPRAGGARYLRNGGISHRPGGEYVGRFPRSVIKFTREAMNRGSRHPSQKPVALMEYLIRTYSDEGQTVLDNVMGSGTTGVACARTGRNFIGIEKDASYFEVARDRIAAER